MLSRYSGPRKEGGRYTRAATGARHERGRKAAERGDWPGGRKTRRRADSSRFGFFGLRMFLI
jgi:hypothetical protein